MSAVLKQEEDVMGKAIEAGKVTIEHEIDGLKALHDALDEKFVAAVELIYGLKGRLIVSGMGKSGHIGCKIAATLASTGTPSFFVHPGEASHGDLGMITEEDAVLMLSNSGETKELEDMVGYCKRYGIPMIAMVRRKESMLVDAADVPLVLPATPEMSPTGAPTTSTTMMLAFGDAIAMALVELRGFSKEDFGVYHPGGKLGQGLMRVSALMHSGEIMPLVAESDIMEDVLVVMTQKALGCAGVLGADGKLLGVVTDGDLRRHMGSDLLKQTAAQVMTANPISVPANMLAVEAVGIMNQKSITSVFVVEGEKPVGLLHLHDCLRAGVV